MTTIREPVEGKVWGSTIGSGSGAIVSAFVLWILGITIWGASPTAENATQAVSAVPLPVAGFVGLLLTVGGTFVGGYLTKHTPRLIEGVLGGEIDEEGLNDEWPLTAESEKPVVDPVQPIKQDPESYKA